MMNIRFLGTSASPSCPIPFCLCDYCATFRRNGGRNLRRRSSLLVNDDLLIDIGPDVITASFDHSISIQNVKFCLQTHSHEDHFDPELIISRHSAYGTSVNNELQLVASNSTLARMDGIISRRCGYGSIFEPDVQNAFHLSLRPLRYFERMAIGKYIVIGLEANHDTSEACMLFSIQCQDAAILYATDTSILPDSTLDFLQKSEITYDLVVLDHTYGIGYESKPGDHLGIDDFVSHANSLKSGGKLKRAGEIYATHLSHEGLLDHDIMEQYALDHGYRIAFDGLSLRLGL